MAFPVSGVHRQFITYRDAKGNTARTSFYMNDNGADADALVSAGNAIVTAIDALTNAALQSLSGFQSAFGTLQYGAHPSEYQPIQTKAKLTYQAADGSLHRLQIPSPIQAMFLADLETVNPANPAILALNALFVASAVPASGTPYVSTRSGLLMQNYIGGVLAVTKLRRKLNIAVLTPSLTPSEPGE